jgi:hypothetical protein
MPRMRKKRQGLCLTQSIHTSYLKSLAETVKEK